MALDTVSPDASSEPAPQSVSAQPPTGLISLCIVASQHQISAEPAQLLRALGLSVNSPIGTTEILLAAKELGLTAKPYTSNWSRLDKLKSPPIAELADGSFIVILRLQNEDQLLIADPRIGRSRLVSRDEFEQHWTVSGNPTAFFSSRTR